MTSVPVLGTVVEGHGEVAAVPVLLRRIALDIFDTNVEVPPPFRLRRSQMADSGLVSRASKVAAARVGYRGGVVVIADADDDCAVQFAATLREAAKPVDVQVAIAVREFEAWFLSTVDSLQSHRAVVAGAHAISDPERLNNPKAKMNELMTEGYRATIHQPAFAARMDLSTARRCRSFDHLVECVGRVIA